jgi:CheY-like chemotaxis protein
MPVDVDDLTRAVMYEVLAHGGYSKVIETDDGTTALDLFKTNRVDLLITDIQRPDMCGVDLIHAVREIDPDIKVIVVSAADSHGRPIPTWRPHRHPLPAKTFRSARVRRHGRRGIRRRYFDYRLGRALWVVHGTRALDCTRDQDGDPYMFKLCVNHHLASRRYARRTPARGTLGTAR